SRLVSFLHPSTRASFLHRPISSSFPPTLPSHFPSPVVAPPSFVHAPFHLRALATSAPFISPHPSIHTSIPLLVK
ncbi:hypothetical protein C8R44DRAFT_809399, partial [Mycena epipterygia]